jgi:hypothetical protein
LYFLGIKGESSNGFETVITLKLPHKFKFKMHKIKKILNWCFILLWAQYIVSTAAYEVEFALNLGGDNFTDSEGINYQQDASTIGNKGTLTPLNFTCASKADLQLYEKCRSHNQQFGYQLPVLKDGVYVLILKFAMTSSGGAGQYVFDVTLNDKHTILSNVDHEKSHGKNCAYDEYAYFTICRNTLMYKNQYSTITDKKILLNFKPTRNFAHISAIALLRGSIGEKRKLSSSNSNEIMYFDPGSTISCNQTTKNTKLEELKPTMGLKKLFSGFQFDFHNFTNLNINNNNYYYNTNDKDQENENILEL